MKIRKNFSQVLKIVLLQDLFNKKHGTSIQTDVEVMDGTCFVLIDFGESSLFQVFDFAFQLGFLEYEGSYNGPNKYKPVNLKEGQISLLEGDNILVKLENGGIANGFTAEYNGLMPKAVSLTDVGSQSLAFDLSNIEKDQVFFFAFQVSFALALHMDHGLDKYDSQRYFIEKSSFESIWATETGRDLRG